MAVGWLVAAAVVGCGPTPPASPEATTEKTEASPATPSPATPVSGNTAGQMPAAQPDSAASPLDRLVADLEAASNTDAAVAAIDAIGRLGQRAAAALPAIVKATDSPEPTVRWHAARAIGLVGEDALGELPRLRAMLDDDDPLVVTQAATAIGRIRHDDERDNDSLDEDSAREYAAATEALVATMVHPDPRVRRASLRSLKIIQPPREVIVPLVTQRLSDEDPSVVLPALHTMADLGEVAVPFLLDSLDDPRARYWATVVLNEIGPAAVEAIPPLVAIAADDTVDPEERMQALLAAAAIGRIEENVTGRGDTEEAKRIAELVSNSEGPVRFAATYAAGMMRDPAAIEPLESLAGGDDRFLSAVAHWALARIEPDDTARIDQAFARLTKALDNDNPTIRRTATSALSDLTDEMSPEQIDEFLPLLVRLLDDTSPMVQRTAAAAVVRLGSSAVAGIEPLLDDPQRQNFAAELLATIGPGARGAVGPLLAAAVNDEADEAFRSEALMAIGAFAESLNPTATQDAVDRILPLVENKQTPAPVRYTAIYAAGRFGEAASSVAPLLRRLIDDDDQLLATIAAWAGLKVEPNNRDLYDAAIPLLTEALRSENDLVRLEAAVALGDIGPHAASAVPMLELVEEDDTLRSVRSAARRALAKIGGG
jgi:HEAT repeat protein